MNYSEIFHFMRPELTLIVTIALLFLFDLFAPERLRRYFHPLACVLLTVQILVNIVPTPDSGQLFGGMYQYEPMQSIVKSMLAIGTLIVFLQSNEWLRREDTAHKRGEFYLLTLSTLLGMYFMISVGNFLMFFLGMGGIDPDGLSDRFRQIPPQLGRSGRQIHPLRPVFERSDALRHLVHLRHGRYALFRRHSSGRLTASNYGAGVLLLRFRLQGSRSYRSTSGRPTLTRERPRPSLPIFRSYRKARPLSC